MYISVAGVPNEQLGPAGQAFVKDFGATQSSGTVDPYSTYAAQAASVLLASIAASDGTRAGVASQLLTAKVINGLLGTFSINKNGDTTSNPVTQYKVVNGASTTYKVITPPLTLVKVS